ncbi:MAG: hypothetical protein KatS3mg129_0024 [Leptospiraceae bacterium]|nr:MAG: hypothetical protein KatS3mg129_0024 [Leptospiraceae bacterium]
MPYYDFECLDCKKISTVKLSVKDIEEGKKVECKYCHSYNTQRYFQPIAVNTSSNSKEEFQGCGEHCKCFPNN